MGRILAVLSAVLLLLTASFAQTAPARIRIGDELGLTLLGEKEVSGSYTVQDDGAIYVPRVGRIRLVGRTVAEGQTLLTAKFRSVYRDPAVYLSIKKQRTSSVFVVGGTEGLVDIAPGTDLRQVYARAQVKEEADLLRVSVFRQGVRLATMSASDLLAGRSGTWTGPLAANDVVVIEPAPFVRVWVTGSVRNPGKIRLAEGDDVYRAIAQAGDLSAGDANSPVMRSEVMVTVRRGPETIRVPLVPTPGQKTVPLEDGDTIVVEPPAYVRVTVAGEVTRPGEIVVREGAPVLSALASAGGILPTGTARTVYMFRGGEANILDTADPGTGGTQKMGTPLQANDVVFVPRNERVFYAFGEVSKPGRYLMEDNREYRLSDVLAEAQGLTKDGTTTRVYLVRPNAEGQIKPVVYHLDQYLKNGKLDDNPIVRPNDMVVFDRTRPNGINVVTQAVSSLLLFNAFRR